MKKNEITIALGSDFTVKKFDEIDRRIDVHGMGKMIEMNVNQTTLDVWRTVFSEIIRVKDSFFENSEGNVEKTPFYIVKGERTFVFKVDDDIGDNVVEIKSYDTPKK